MRRMSIKPPTAKDRAMMVKAIALEAGIDTGGTRI
jgi:hypothetical protein